MTNHKYQVGQLVLISDFELGRVPAIILSLDTDAGHPSYHVAVSLDKPIPVGPQPAKARAGWFIREYDVSPFGVTKIAKVAKPRPRRSIIWHLPASAIVI